jgi:glycosyltransferase involved in cell wall biosynthesis
MDQNNAKKILILTNQPFPVGFAGTNRILSYCKGFLHHGYQPEVCCMRPTDSYKNVINTSVNGRFEDINFYYPGRTVIRVSSFWRKRINDFVAYFLSMKTLLFLLQKENVLFVVYYGTYFLPELSCIFLTRLFGKQIFKEESENPHIYFKDKSNLFENIIEWLYINRLYKLYSGIFVMTNPLRDFFIDKGIPGKKILVVAHTVDQERFEKKNCNSDLFFANEYIAYLGSLNQQKDGVLTLVKSFIKVVEKYPEMHLVIAGTCIEEEKNELLSLIDQLKLNENVHYLGWISSNKIPLLFQGAHLLASCRTKSYQNEYSFPTKVVEYLATGIPVVTTAPGDLDFYLKDRENAFVANNDDPDEFALKILEALQDYDFAVKVGQNGKLLVKDKFNPITQTKMIIDFCKV